MTKISWLVKFYWTIFKKLSCCNLKTLFDTLVSVTGPPWSESGWLTLCFYKCFSLSISPFVFSVVHWGIVFGPLQGVKGVRGRRGPKGTKGKPGPQVRVCKHNIGEEALDLIAEHKCNMLDCFEMYVKLDSFLQISWKFASCHAFHRENQEPLANGSLSKDLLKNIVFKLHRVQSKAPGSCSKAKAKKKLVQAFLFRAHYIQSQNVLICSAV